MNITNTKALSLCKLFGLATYLFVGLLSCQKPNEPPPNPPTLSSEKSITTFSFATSDNPGLTTVVVGVIMTDTIRVLFPTGTALTSLKPTIIYNGKSVSPASKESRNFSSTVQYTVTAEDGSTKNYSVLATTSATWIDSANIHIVGRENGYIYYWKNGYKSSLGTTTNGNGIANAVVVSDTNVYVVGRIGFTSKLWKNGVPTNLTDGSAASDAKAITVVGNDVYIAGFEYGSNNNKTLMWKNGVRSVVANGAPLTYDGMGIGVSGNDVYICGNINEHAYVWKNGVGTRISDSSSSYVFGLFVAGTDVYIVGRENGKAVYWKNGVKTALSAQSSFAYAIAVSGTDVYVVGNENSNTAVYWKNGVKNVLVTSQSGYASANAIKILDTDVYIVGTIGGGFFNTDVCWKNGVRHNVSLTPNNNMATGEAYGIEVIRL
jgi:hypothetical protein